MKKLILLLLLIPSLAWGQVSTSGVSLSGCATGGTTTVACDAANDYVGKKTDGGRTAPMVHSEALT